MAINTDEVSVTYEELIQLELDFVEAEDEILKKQYELEAPLYKRRHALVSRIPNFWALVLEQAPPDVDQYIQPSDSQVFGECLTSITVDRFEIANTPRSFSLRFTFSPNEWFEDEVLEKKFWYRRAKDDWVGHVSTPVRVHWKKGKDLSNGLTDAAFDFWEAIQSQQQLATNGTGKAKPISNMKEYKAIMSKMERFDPTSCGFFTFFGFISDRRYVSAEESKKANIAAKEKKAKVAKGENVEMLEEEDMDESADVEVCPHGADLATMLVEDVWPNAIKYFTSAQEMDDEELSEVDFEEGSDDSDEEIDIRALVKGKGGKRKDKVSDGETPPPKSRKTLDD